MRRVDRLALFDISEEHTTGSIIKLTDYLCRHTVENASTDEYYLDEFNFFRLVEILKLKYKFAQMSNETKTLINRPIK